MAKGKKQKKEKIIYNREDAYQSLGIINSWINSMDTKVSFALTLAGVLIGMTFREGLPCSLQKVVEVDKLADLSGSEAIAAILVCALYLFSFISIICLMLVIIARGKNVNCNSSVFFFGSISTMGLDEYKEKVKCMTEEDIVEDLKEQVHTNSRICMQKTRWYNIGMKFLVATVVLWFVCMVFRLI